MESNVDISQIRKDYSLQSFSESDAEAYPILQFEKWWKDAEKSEVIEVNAMTLATCTTKGIPSARIVLLKYFNDEGFTFFTNYESNKGKELEENPFASLVFFWKELERQVRIQGTVKKVSSLLSDEYFLQRPEQSRIGAWSSPQSQIIPDRSVLEQNVEKYNLQFKHGNIPRPSNWGGYIVSPSSMEFWQGRRSRLHDRLLYTVTNNRKWKIERLAP